MRHDARLAKLESLRLRLADKTKPLSLSLYLAWITAVLAAMRAAIRFSIVRLMKAWPSCKHGAARQ